MVAETTTRPRLKARYEDEIIGKLREKFELKNLHEVPWIEKIIINCGVGRFLENQKLRPEVRDTVIDTLTTISGQKPVMVKAKKSVANFKVREGAPSGFMVTLRRERMWHFLDRLLNLAVPRIKDFRGLNDKAFDKAGNYSLGLNEQAVWPEINMANVNFTHGMNINIVVRNSDREKTRFLLEELGMPFVRRDEQSRRGAGRGT